MVGSVGSHTGGLREVGPNRGGLRGCVDGSELTHKTLH